MIGQITVLFGRGATPGVSQGTPLGVIQVARSRVAAVSCAISLASSYGMPSLSASVLMRSRSLPFWLATIT
jgi:hypothetical protein